MVENQQSLPSLEELRAAKAALEKKPEPSLEQLRAAKAAQDTKKAPPIPPVESPTEPTVPFDSAQPSDSPSQSLGGPSAPPSTTTAGQKPSAPKKEEPGFWESVGSTISEMFSTTPPVGDKPSEAERKMFAERKQAAKPYQGPAAPGRVGETDEAGDGVYSPSNRVATQLAPSAREYGRALNLYNQYNKEYLDRVENRKTIEQIAPTKLLAYDKETQRLAEEAVKWNKYKNSLESSLNKLILNDIDALVEQGYADQLYRVGKDGVLNVNEDAINEYVDKTIEKYQIEDTSSLDIKELWTNAAAGRIQNIEKEKAGNAAIESWSKAKNIEQQKFISESLPNESDYRAKIESLGKRYGDLAKGEIDQYDKTFIAPRAEKLNQEYSAKAAQVQSEANRLNSLYSSGLIPQDQYSKAFTDLQTRLEEEYKAYETSVAELAKVAESEAAKINFRWNQQYAQAQKAEQDNYNKQIDKLNQELSAKYGSDELLKKEALQIFRDAWSKQEEKERQAQIDVGIVTKEQAERAGVNQKLLQASVDIERLVKRYEKGLGGAIKSIGTSLGSESVYNLGNELEGRYVLPQVENKGWKDLGSFGWFERQSELFGYMTPSLAATIGASVITSPMGGGGGAVTARLLMSGAAGWGVETAQIMADIRSRVLEETGSIEKADKAAQRAFDAQMAISYGYLLEGAPFIKLPFLKGGRIKSALTGFAGEYGQELLMQEGPQQIAEKRIVDEALGKIKLGEGLTAAYDNFYQGVVEMATPKTVFGQQKPSELEQLAVDLIGIGGVGAVGGYRQAAEKRRDASNAMKSILANEIIAKHIKSGEFQWLDNVVNRRGNEFANQLVSNMAASGLISSQQKETLLRKVDDVVSLNNEVERANLSGDEAVAYRVIASRAMDLRRESEAEQSPVLKDAKAAQARALEAELKDIATGNGIKGLVVTYPDGKKKFLNVGEAKQLMQDPESVELIAIMGLQRSGGISMTAYGPDMDVSLTELWENVVDLQNTMERDIGAVNKKYSTSVEYTKEGIEVSGKNPDNVLNAQSELSRLGYNVIGYEPPVDQQPITEEEVAGYMPGTKLELTGEQLLPKATQQTPTTDAVQEPTTAEVGAQPSRTEGPREEGGGEVRPGVEGTQAPQAGGAQAEVAPAATTEAIAAPKAETLEKMNTLADLEVKSDENQNKNKQTRASAKRKMEKMLAEDARLAEVNANFDKAVNDLEKAGKLKVRCP